MTACLFHVSDLHFGREDKGALAWFAAEVARVKPAGVLVTGDFTQSARSVEFSAAGAWLRALATPVAVTPGNHDILWHNPVERAFSPYRRFARMMEGLGPPPAPEGVHLVLLQTTARAQWRLNWAEGLATSRRVTTAVSALRARPEGALSLVLCHHPLVDRAGLQVPGRTAGGRTALERLAQAGADAILSGHVHDGFDDQVTVAGRALRLIGAGTLSERLRATRPSYNRIGIGEAGLDVERCLMT